MTKDIDRVAGLSIAELQRQYLDRNEPVIVTDHVAGWPAAAKWTPEYMARTLGHKNVPVVSMRDGDYAHGDRREMSLKSYLQLIGAIESTGADAVQADPERTHYLAQVSIANFLPELLDDIREPPFFPDETFSSSVIYIGGTLFSQLHYHPRGSATLCLLYGKKHVRLFPPDQTPKLYPYPLHSGLAHVSQTRHKHPDPGEFPKFAKAQCREATVSAGELLFIPVYWWHSIENEDISIATVFFWSTSWQSRFLPPPGPRAPYLYQPVDHLVAFSKRVVNKAVKVFGGGSSRT